MILFLSLLFVCVVCMKKAGIKVALSANAGSAGSAGSVFSVFACKDFSQLKKVCFCSKNTAFVCLFLKKSVYLQCSKIGFYLSFKVQNMFNQ